MKIFAEKRPHSFRIIVGCSPCLWMYDCGCQMNVQIWKKNHSLSHSDGVFSLLSLVNLAHPMQGVRFLHFFVFVKFCLYCNTALDHCERIIKITFSELVLFVVVVAAVLSVRFIANVKWHWTLSHWLCQHNWRRERAYNKQILPQLMTTASLSFTNIYVQWPFKSQIINRKCFGNG